MTITDPTPRPPALPPDTYGPVIAWGFRDAMTTTDRVRIVRAIEWLGARGRFELADQVWERLVAFDEAAEEESERTKADQLAREALLQAAIEAQVDADIARAREEVRAQDRANEVAAAEFAATLPLIPALSDRAVAAADTIHDPTGGLGDE